MSEPHRFAVRVYYEDTDFSGVVYHASYLRFLERGRTEFLRARGVAQADMRDDATGRPIGFAVRSMSIDFLRPARMDDRVAVTTRVVALGGASLDLAQTIERDGATLVTATVRIALVSDGRPTRFPHHLRSTIGGPRTVAADHSDEAASGRQGKGDTPKPRSVGTSTSEDVP